jgi:hypothetical protein
MIESKTVRTASLVVAGVSVLTSCHVREME